jgi:hypothetical protein
MICTETAEYVSALCDGEIIPAAAAEHIGACPACRAILRDYLELGAELRRTASLEQPAPVPARTWTRPHNPVTALLQKGWGTMRIPRLAFVALIVCLIAIASTLAVVKVRAHSTGTVVLLNTAGPTGPFVDCPLSTQDSKPACDWYGTMGSQNLAYRVRLLSRDGGRVLLAIRTRTFTRGEDLSSFTFDADPAETVREVWFTPGEKSTVDVSGVGTLTLTGQWMDHMPMFLGSHGEDISPGPNELRFGRPLLLKDKVVVGDLASVIGGIYSTDTPDRASAFYVPEQGRFLISLLPMKGAVEAHVELGRISFEEGGHSWELVNGIPVCRADRLWVLHQLNFKRSAVGWNGDHVSFGNPKLVQTAPGIWEPAPITN